MIRKHLLVPERRRQPPREGFSWVDRRFLREHAPALSRDAILLYFFLCAVADKDGLSFYSDATTVATLRLNEEAVVEARGQLLRRSLVAHEPPLTQVLALPELRLGQRDDGGPQLVSDILRRLAEHMARSRARTDEPPSGGNP